MSDIRTVVYASPAPGLPPSFDWAVDPPGLSNVQSREQREVRV